MKRTSIPAVPGASAPRASRRPLSAPATRRPIIVLALAVAPVLACGDSDATTEPLPPPPPTAPPPPTVPPPLPPPNGPPTAAAVPTQEMLEGDTLRIRGADHFADPDGDRLTYRAFTSDEDVALVRVEGDTLVLEAGTRGRATISWWAEDPSHATALTRFEVLVTLPRSEDHPALVALYETLNGPEWHNKENWLSHEPISEWWGVSTDRDRRVTGLDLGFNNVHGEFPSEIRQLTKLAYLNLWGNRLTGTLPEALAELPDLQSLYVSNNQLSGDLAVLGKMDQLADVLARDNQFTGPIPEALAAKHATLRSMDFAGNRLTGSIPAGLGDLALYTLRLNGNELTGPIPPELGQLSLLYDLDLGDNQLTGPIPASFGGLARLGRLSLAGNDLEGGAPPELSYLRNSLEWLNVSRNPRLSGPIPSSWTDLRLIEMIANDTDLCLPATEEFREWRMWTTRVSVPACGADAFPLYLTQAIQSFDSGVPLVAGDSALLRVFPTTDGDGTFPAVTAGFYLGGARVHEVDIPARADPIPAEVDESDLLNSANAVIPGGVIQPGLEVVVEVDPDGEADPALGVSRRIPESGRVPIDVRAMPVFHMVAVPFIVDSTEDAHIAQLVRDLHPNHDYLWALRDLLPVGEMEVYRHDPVHVSYPSVGQLLDEIEVIRILEGTTHYYAGFVNANGNGVAWVGGKSSVQDPEKPEVLAHEIGHNFSLYHAPACEPYGVDDAYPHGDGRIGVWGYDFRVDSLRPPDWPDVMGYCESSWVSDYHFNNAMAHRGRVEVWESVSPARVLLVSGGVSEHGAPYLRPAFDIEAYAHLPRDPGPYAVTGSAADGATLFSHRFDMLRAADGTGAGFAFALPVDPAWADRLTALTLTGPDGTATLDAATDRPSAIVRDPRTGQVRAILHEPTPESLARAVNALLLDDPTLQVTQTRGLPR